MNTARNRIERLEAQAQATSNPIANGLYSFRAVVHIDNYGNVDTYRPSYEVTTTTGEPVALAEEIEAWIEATLETELRAGICRPIYVYHDGILTTQ